jgi:hypothetical protein
MHARISCAQAVFSVGASVHDRRVVRRHYRRVKHHHVMVHRRVVRRRQQHRFFHDAAVHQRAVCHLGFVRRLMRGARSRSTCGAVVAHRVPCYRCQLLLMKDVLRASASGLVGVVIVPYDE